MANAPILHSSIPTDRPATADYLRAKHPRFTYESFSWNYADGALRASFRFRIEPDIDFAPAIVIEQIDPSRAEAVPRNVIDNLIFHLGLIEMLSYWKATCSPEIVINAGHLDSDQISWWLDLIAHGMGEFFYVNRIDGAAPNFVRIVAGSNQSRDREGADTSGVVAEPNQSRDREGADTLVLTSGGKDSVVTLELLREAGRNFACLLLNPTEAAVAIARQAASPSAIIARRSIDPRLLELNAAGYLNGHTPFSALLAFLGTTVAALCGFEYVIVSNERSAEEAAAQFLGREVNHQYSKSFRFEGLFRDYSKRHLTATVDYFSLLRPLYELQIARLFSGYPQYFPLFRSCNRGIKTNSWCGRCPKCMFVFTALYPFIGREQMLGIFGQDLFAWKGAASVLLTLLGLDRDKPFECVGTKEETLAALYLCIQKYQEQGIELPEALRQIENTVLSSQSNLSERTQSILSAWTDQHYLPLYFERLLRQKIKESENT